MVFGQRLSQEYDANVIFTAPNVEYKAEIIDNESVRKKRYNNQSEITISNLSQFPEYVTDVARFYEPMVLLTIIGLNQHLKNIDYLCERIRGERNDCLSIDESRIMVKWRLPLADVISGFFEILKRETRFLYIFIFLIINLTFLVVMLHLIMKRVVIVRLSS